SAVLPPFIKKQNMARYGASFYRKFMEVSTDETAFAHPFAGPLPCRVFRLRGTGGRRFVRGCFVRYGVRRNLGRGYPKTGIAAAAGGRPGTGRRGRRRKRLAPRRDKRRIRPGRRRCAGRHRRGARVLMLHTARRGIPAGGVLFFGVEAAGEVPIL